MVAHARQLVVQQGGDLLVEAAREGMEVMLSEKASAAQTTE
jgi:hypothetical protein